jgi:hypothetical protein
MIEKPTIIITSLGRTGTTFFTAFFRNNFKNAASLHEPGRIDIKNFKIKKILETVKTYGFTRSVLKKIIGRWDITYLSNQRLASKITPERAAEKLYTVRKNFINNFQKNLYIESSYHYYGLLDILPLAFKDHKVAYIVRDPRNWVRSWMNLKVLYHRTDIRYLLGDRPTPKMVNDKNYSTLWKKMDQFERLCWAWSYINNYAVKSLKNNPDAKLYFFEDLFISNDKVKNLYELIKFTTNFKSIKIKIPKNIELTIKNSLGEKINEPQAHNFPKWNEWKPEQAQKLHKICGPLMQEFDYGNEPEWKKLINS